MSKKWQKLVDELKIADPEEILQEFVEETGNEEKFILKSLHDVVLQNRQRKQITRTYFLR